MGVNPKQVDRGTLGIDHVYKPSVLRSSPKTGHVEVELPKLPALTIAALRPRLGVTKRDRYLANRSSKLALPLWFLR